MKLLKRQSNVILFLLTIFIFSAYFLKLFYPETKIYFTPEIGRSDIWNLNYPKKVLLSRSLKKFTLPFWEKNAGTGFPIFAEGEVGALNLQNLIVYFIFPENIAFNINYVLIFLTAYLGFYFFAKHNKVSKISAVIGSFSFVFGAFFILHTHHINMIQTASYFPWLLLFGQKLGQNRIFRNMLLFIFVLSQMILSGHFQLLIYCLVFLVLYFLGINFRSKYELLIKRMTSLFLGILFAFLVSSAQLLPTMELLKSSARGIGSLRDILSIPYKFDQLIYFVSPKFLGTPQDGNYPTENYDTIGLYWENNAYVGIIPILFLIFYLFKKRKSLLEKVSIVMLFFALILSFNFKSPFVFLLFNPIIGSFRVPSRFLFFASFFICFLFALNLDFLMYKLKKHLGKSWLIIFFVIILSLQFYDLFRFGGNYHPLVKASDAAKKPVISNLIGDSRYLSHSSVYQSQMRYYFKNGWTKPGDYLYFVNSLDPDANLIHGMQNIQSYIGGIPLLRQASFNQITDLNILRISSYKYVISTTPLISEFLKPIQTICYDSVSVNYYLYENLDVIPRFRFADVIVNQEIDYKNPQEAFSGWIDNLAKVVVVENNIDKNVEYPRLDDIRVLNDTNLNLTLETHPDSDSMLLVSDTFYPSWEVKVNGNKSKIYPVNINQRGVILDRGSNVIEMYYSLTSFYLGMGITILSLLSLIVLQKYINKTFS